jgi:hypothetical protein
MVVRAEGGQSAPTAGPIRRVKGARLRRRQESIVQDRRPRLGEQQPHVDAFGLAGLSAARIGRSVLGAVPAQRDDPGALQPARWGVKGGGQAADAAFFNGVGGWPGEQRRQPGSPFAAQGMQAIRRTIDVDPFAVDGSGRWGL